MAFTHEMSLRAAASPAGDIIWVSGPLPGALHDLTAARIWGIVATLAAYTWSRWMTRATSAKTPSARSAKARNKPMSQQATADQAAVPADDQQTHNLILTSSSWLLVKSRNPINAKKAFE